MLLERAHTLLLLLVHRNCSFNIELVDCHPLCLVLVVVFNRNITHRLSDWLLPQLLLRLLVAPMVTGVAARGTSTGRRGYLAARLEPLSNELLGALRRIVQTDLGRI